MDATLFLPLYRCPNVVRSGGMTNYLNDSILHACTAVCFDLSPMLDLSCVLTFM